MQNSSLAGGMGKGGSGKGGRRNGTLPAPVINTKGQSAFGTVPRGRKWVRVGVGEGL